MEIQCIREYMQQFQYQHHHTFIVMIVVKLVGKKNIESMKKSAYHKVFLCNNNNTSIMKPDSDSDPTELCLSNRKYHNLSGIELVLRASPLPQMGFCARELAR